MAFQSYVNVKSLYSEIDKYELNVGLVDMAVMYFVSESD